MKQLAVPRKSKENTLKLSAAFQVHRKIFMHSYISTIWSWFLGLSPGCIKWKACENLIRVVSSLLESNGCPPSTGYIKEKFSYALRNLGYGFVKENDRRKYTPIYNSLPLPANEFSFNSNIRMKADGETLTLQELREGYIRPVIEALKASQDYRWDEPALLIMEAVDLISKDPKSFLFLIEKRLWDAASLLGYHLTKSQEKTMAA